MSSIDFLHLGNPVLTLPLAAAIAASLLGAHERRAAVGWLLLFAAALALVGISKVAYLGWGTGIPAWRFQAFSGHAAGASAVYPMLCYLLLRRWPAPASALGIGAGLALGAALSAVLVARGEHTLAEAWAGWTIGAAAAAASIGLTRAGPRPARASDLMWGLPAFLMSSWAMQQAQLGYWMQSVAVALSGNTYPFRWHSCG